jgi:hypothetical protein
MGGNYCPATLHAWVPARLRQAVDSPGGSANRTGDDSRCDAVGAITELFIGLGYTGYFELDDVRRPIEEFDPAQHQNPANVGDRDNDWAPHGVYVDNFAFVPKDG